MSRYLYRLAIATDRLANVALGGAVGETISSRAYRNKDSSRLWAIAYRILNALFFWEADHCKASYEWDRDNKDFGSPKTEA